MIYCVMRELENGTPKRSLWIFENPDDYLLAREIEERMEAKGRTDFARFEQVFTADIGTRFALRKMGRGDDITGTVRHAQRYKSETTGEDSICV